MESLEQRPLIFDVAEVGRAGVFVTLDRDGSLAVYRGYVRPEDEPGEATVANFGDDLGAEGQGTDGDVSTHQLSAGPSAATVITSGGQPFSAGLPDDEDDGALKPLPERLVMELSAFARYAADRGHTWPMTVELCLGWARDGAEIADPYTWARRLDSLRPFSRFLASIDPATRFPFGSPFGHPGQRGALCERDARQRRPAWMTAGCRARRPLPTSQGEQT